MATTIATLAGTTVSGLGNERHIVWCSNAAQWWAFGYTGTLSLASWYSDDGINWTAGATFTLLHAHSSDGRNLAVGYKSISGKDVVYFGLLWLVGVANQIASNVLRATITANTITYHLTETNIQTGVTDSSALLWSGSGLDFDSSNKLHFTGWTSGISPGDVDSADSTADPGTSEQATAVTWTSHTIDGSVTAESRSSVVFDRASAKMGLVADDGNTGAGATGLSYYEWSGSAWTGGSANRDVTGGLISNIDKNDWGAVARSPTDIHVVYRSGSSTYVHRRFNGTTWSSGQSVPTQSSLAAGGIALCTDGASVWLAIIDTDGANTIRYVQWTDSAHNGIADAWNNSWSVAEGSSATRTYLGCAKDVPNNLALLYWTEGSNLVATTFTATSPPDPNGTWIQSAQGSSSVSALTFPVTFSTQNVATGNRIIVAVVVWNSTTTITSVTDSAGNVYVKDSGALVLSDGGDLSIWSAPITAGGGTKPTVTAHASAASSEWAMWVHEYAGLSKAATNYTDGRNGTAYTSSPTTITSGASTPVPGTTGELAFGFYGDSGNTIPTIGVSAGWTQRGTSIQNAGNTCEGATADQNAVAGTGSNASFTLSGGGAPGGVLVVVYKLDIVLGGRGAGDASGLAPPLLPGASPYAQQLWTSPPVTPPPVVAAAQILPAKIRIVLQAVKRAAGW